ncbi:kinase-like protein [Piromyces finnis]|uniref:non-specific serine/threonine protein kinase n=1 Tax=Piromyces finnis TaxID=1754191 RepID=A0A1Y1V383_9FUNG|nr:kinase-like protein [Piromyces finnis]|eukprot:ORX46153.1 kinase-like protein [Piromyces finnis]
MTSAEYSLHSSESSVVLFVSSDNEDSSMVTHDLIKVPKISQADKQDIFSQESFESQTQTQTQTQTQKTAQPPIIFKENQWALLRNFNLPHSNDFYCSLPSILLRFGRHRNCDYVIKGNCISGIHFILYLKRNEITKEYYVEIENIGKNGTTVNSVNLKEHQKLTLTNNDIISVVKDGDQSYEFLFLLNHSFKESNPNTIYSKYEIKNIIGSGAFSTVRKAIRKSDGAEFAVKIIEIGKFYFNEAAKIGFKREIEILQKLDHKNIIKFCECIQEDEKLYLVTELMKGGNLLNLIEQKNGIPEIESRILYRQILEGLKYLHDRKITHRDIKPDNILLEIEKYNLNHNDSYSQNIDTANDFKVIAKISDFGTAKDTGLQTFCGTPSYLAPEIMNNNTGQKKFYDSKVDCWSLGVVLFQMLSNLLPHKDFNKSIIDFTNNIWTRVSFNVIDLIENLLIVDKEKRFSCDQALNHPWFSMPEEDIINEPKLISKRIKNWGMLTYNEKDNKKEENMKFDSDIILLGGNKRCTVYLPDKEISQLHLIFCVMDNIPYIIDKSKSSNKVFIDDRILKKNEPTMLDTDCNIKLTDSDDKYYQTEFVINLDALKNPNRKSISPCQTPHSSSPNNIEINAVPIDNSNSRKRKYSNEFEFNERNKRSNTVGVHNESNSKSHNKHIISIIHHNSQSLEPSFANLSLSNEDVWLELIPMNSNYSSHFYIKNNIKRFVIGRNQECTIQINHLIVSNFHVEVLKDNNTGDVYLKDNSSNGTYINHVRIKNQIVKLRNNEKVIFIYKNYKLQKDDDNVEVGYIFSFKK